MEPENQNKKGIKLDLSAGQPGIAPSFVNLNVDLTYNPQKVSELIHSFSKKGITPDLLQQNYYVIVQLNCISGSQSYLLEEFQRIQNQNNGQVAQQKILQPSIFNKLIKQMIGDGVIVKCFSYENKLFLFINLRQSFQDESLRQYLDFNTQININLQIQAQKKIEENKKQNQATLNIQYIGLKLFYQQSKKLSTYIKKFIPQSDKQIYPIRSLPQLKKADIKIKFNSIQKMTQLTKFQLSSSNQQFLDVTSSAQYQIQNNISFSFIGKSKFALTGTAHFDDLRFICGRYLDKFVRYLDL